MKQKTIREKFDELNNQRTNKLLRAEECAELTIPGLYIKDEEADLNSMPVTWTSKPAMCVSSLASKVVSAIYPVGQQPFYGFNSPALEQAQSKDVLAIKEKLASLENSIYRRLSESNFRAALFTAITHLIVLGDSLIRINNDGNFQVFRLDSFVVRRDYEGRVICAILREWVDPDYVEDSWKALKKTSGETATKHNKTFEPVYTETVYDSESKRWTITREFRDTVVEKPTNPRYNPYLILRWSQNVGEDYGRSLCEENIGDLRSIQALAKAQIELAAAMAEYRIGVKPGGVTKIEDLWDSEQGDYVDAREEDIFTITANLGGQLQYITQALEMKEAALGRVFLQDSMVQPKGQERVTARQINVLVNELQSALNAPLTALHADIQKPVVLKYLEIMKDEGIVSDKLLKMVDSGRIGIRVRTGLEALNREIEETKLSYLGQVMAQLPEPGQKVVNWGGFIRAMWTASGTDPRGIIYSDQEIAQRDKEDAMLRVKEQAANTAVDALATQATTQGIR